MLCREQVARLARRRRELDATGARVVVIGSGWPAMAAAFAEAFDVPFLLLCDPELTAYRVAGMKRGVSTLLGRRATKAAARALAAGFRQGRTQGDPLQQGGVLVLAAGGEPRFVQISEKAGEHAEEEEVLAAAREASRPSC